MLSTTSSILNSNNNQNIRPTNSNSNSNMCLPQNTAASLAGNPQTVNLVQGMNSTTILLQNISSSSSNGGNVSNTMTNTNPISGGSNSSPNLEGWPLNKNHVLLSNNTPEQQLNNLVCLVKFIIEGKDG